MANLQKWAQVKTFTTYRGKLTALCNVPNTLKTWSDVEKARNEPISKDVFSASMAMIGKRYNKPIDIDLAAFYYKELQGHCGNSEYIAAFEDFMRSREFISNFLPYIIDHVKQQRMDGPDPIVMTLKEKGFYAS